jgi:hypothetical protein
MLDLDQINRGNRGRGTGASGFPRAGRARPRGCDHINRDEGGSGMRFASDSLQTTSETSRGRGPNGLDRLASHQLERISINLALSLRGPPRRSHLDRSSAQRPKIAPRGPSPRVAMTIGVSDAT